MSFPHSARKVLKVSELSKSMGGVPVMERLNMDLALGQTGCLVSDNRDRLNLLIDVLSGSAKEDSGAIFLAEGATAVGPLTVRQRLERGAAARERPALIDKLSILDNVFLGSAGKWTRFGLLRVSRMRKRAAQALESVDLQAPLDAPLGSLSPSGKILVAIARALVKDGAFYVFDSVTRAMNVRQYEAFVAIVQDLKAKGRAVVVVPVGAEDIRAFGDRLFLLKGTQLNEIERPRELPDDELNGLFLHGEKRDVSRISDPIHRARAWIEQRVGEGAVDFKQIADSVFMSYDNFRRKFKHQSGLSPNQYFIKLKIEKAKESLIFSDLEIKEIAERLGFSDPYYFSRVFKEWEGVSPVRYRKEKSP